MPFLFTVDLTIPANTLEKDAVRSAVRLPSRCVVDRLVLHVPPGHQAVVPVWVEVNRAQVIPDASQGSGEIRLDSTPDLELLAAPIAIPRAADVALAGYNEDAANGHTTRLLVIGRFNEDLSDTERRRFFG